MIEVDTITEILTDNLTLIAIQINRENIQIPHSEVMNAIAKSHDLNDVLPFLFKKVKTHYYRISIKMITNE